MEETVNNASEIVNTTPEAINNEPGGINSAQESSEETPTMDDPTATTGDVAGLFPTAHRELSEALARIHDEMVRDNASTIERLTELRNRRRQILEAGIERHQRETDELMGVAWGPNFPSD
jgi:hypothetical protein